MLLSSLAPYSESMDPISLHVITEPISPYERHICDVERTLLSGRTALQHFDIIELFGYGSALLLDGRVQSTARDEAIYHEALLYPAYCLKQAVKRVLVLGGANGGVLHRLRNLPNLEKVIQIDVDRELLPITRKYLPHMHRAVEDDSRMHVTFGDPRTLVSLLNEPFDLAICDLPDAVEGSLTTSLFTREFYCDIKRLLGNTGVFATQAGPANFLDAAFFASVLSTARSVFQRAEPYSITVPSFGVPWGFVVASDNIDLSSVPESFIERWIDQLSEQPFCYDPATHRHLFSLPKHIRRALEAHGKVSSDALPIHVAS